MTPERWSQITTTFVLERDKTLDLDSPSSVTSSRRRICSTREEREIRQCSINLPRENNSNGQENVLGSTINDSGNKGTSTYLKIQKDTTESTTQTDDLVIATAKHMHAHARKSDTESESTEKAKSTLLSNFHQVGSVEELVHRVTCLEENFQEMTNFLKCPASQFEVPAFTRCGPMSNVNDKPPLKSWIKQPKIYPKPTYGSVIREAYCRSKPNVEWCDAVIPDQSNTLIGSLRRNMKVKVESNLELRVQQIESLVVELKKKVMKLVLSGFGKG